MKETNSSNQNTVIELKILILYMWYGCQMLNVKDIQ